MGKKTIACLACALALAAGCAHTSNPLVGTWEMVYPAVDTTHDQLPPVKILSDTHFAFGSRGADGDLFAGGGTYVLRDGVYTELVQYHSIGFLAGRSLRFTTRIEGDLWYHRGAFDIDGRQFSVDEIWRRIEK
ncbi:MAG: hypothetical protein JW876_10880 [Candidatus Krumholzibacteriota bacterium]|nr:hypothetical protein [Candidatus Krumholzibacteriota bacterium]